MRKTSFEPSGVFRTCMGVPPSCSLEERPPYLVYLPTEATDQPPERVTMELAMLQCHSNRQRVLFVLMNTVFPDNLVSEKDMYQSAKLTVRERFPTERSVLAKFSSSLHREHKFVSSIGDSQHDEVKKAMATTTTTTTALSRGWITFGLRVGDVEKSGFPPHILGNLTGVDQRWYYPFLDLIVVDTEEDLREAREHWVIAATDAILDRTKVHTDLNIPSDAVLKVHDVVNSHWGYFVHRTNFTISYLSISDDLEECAVRVYEDNWRDLTDPKDVIYLLREHAKIMHWGLSTRAENFNQKIQLVTEIFDEV